MPLSGYLVKYHEHPISICHFLGFRDVDFGQKCDLSNSKRFKFPINLPIMVIYVVDSQKLKLGHDICHNIFYLDYTFIFDLIGPIVSD